MWRAEQIHVLWNKGKYCTRYSNAFFITPRELGTDIHGHGQSSVISFVSRTFDYQMRCVPGVVCARVDLRCVRMRTRVPQTYARRTGIYMSRDVDTLRMLN